MLGLDGAAQNGLQGDCKARCVLDRSWALVTYLMKMFLKLAKYKLQWRSG